MATSGGGGQRPDRRLWRHYVPPAKGEATPEPDGLGEIGPLPPPRVWTRHQPEDDPATPAAARAAGRAKVFRSVGPQPAGKQGSRGRRRGLGVLVALGVAVVGNTVSAFEDDDRGYHYDASVDWSEPDDPFPGEAPSALSPEGVEQITAELEAAAGSTRVVSVGIWADYVRFHTEGPAPDRSLYYDWHRHLGEPVSLVGSRDRVGHQPFDFRDVRGEVLARLAARMEERLGVVPDELRADVVRPAPGEAPQIFVTAVSDVQQGRLVAALDGTILERDFRPLG